MKAEFGLKYGYPRIPLPQKIKGWITAIRPYTLLAPLIGGLTTPIVFLGHTNQLSHVFSVWDTIIYGCVTLILCNMASNLYNQACDADIDKINKPYRPIPQGLLGKEEVITISIILYMIAVLRACMTNLWFGFFVFLILVFTVCYSSPNIRLKKYLWINNISIALPRGLLGYVAAWCILSDPFDILPWAIGIVLCVYLIGSQTSKDFPDVEGDKKFGIRTLPVVYGEKTATIMSAPFLYLSSGVFVIAIMMGIIRVNPISIALACVLFVWSVVISFMMMKIPTMEDKLVENSPVWRHMYLLLFTAQIGFCLIYLWR